MASGTHPYMAACWLNQYHPRNKTRPWLDIASRGNITKPSTVFSRVSMRFAPRSAEPGWGRSRFAAFILQFVQLLFQIRFALLQIFQLAIPVVDVRDVVFHPSSNVKSPAPKFFDLFSLLRNLLIRLRDRIQDLPSPPAP